MGSNIVAYPMIRKIHTYAGLLTFVNLMVYGIAGVAATIDGGPKVEEPRVFERLFTVPPNSTDMQVAERVVAQLGLTLATPVHSFVIQHDPTGRLWLDLRDVNGSHKVTILDREGKIRVEERRNHIGKYLSVLHSTTGVFKSGDWRMQLWAYCNEFAMWCLIAMIGSGAWLWWKTLDRGSAWNIRTIHRWTAVFAFPLMVVYGISGIQMAHRTWIGTGGWLTRLHVSQVTWSALAFAASLGVFTLGATGLVLWLRRRSERTVGALAFGFGVAISVFLIVSMRAG
jgi:hypothetical protein